MDDQAETQNFTLKIFGFDDVYAPDVDDMDTPCFDCSDRVRVLFNHYQQSDGELHSWSLGMDLQDLVKSFLWEEAVTNMEDNDERLKAVNRRFQLIAALQNAVETLEAAPLRHGYL